MVPSIQTAISDLADSASNPEVDVREAEVDVSFNDETGKVEIEIERRSDEDAQDLEDLFKNQRRSIIDSINANLEANGISDLFVEEVSDPEYTAAAVSNDESDDAIIFGLNMIFLIAIGVLFCCCCICLYGIYASYTSYKDDEFDDTFFNKVQRRVSRAFSHTQTPTGPIHHNPLDDIKRTKRSDDHETYGKVELQEMDKPSKRLPGLDINVQKPSIHSEQKRLPGAYPMEATTLEGVRDSALMTPMSPDTDTDPGLTPRTQRTLEDLFNGTVSPSADEDSRYDSSQQNETKPYFSHEESDQSNIPPSRRKIAGYNTSELEFQAQHHEVQTGAYLTKTDSEYAAEDEHMDIQSGAYLDHDSGPQFPQHTFDDSVLNDLHMTPFTPVVLDGAELLGDVEELKSNLDLLNY